MANDALGERMKIFESAEAGRRLMPLLPALARIDGRNFSAFTRGMQRPYDERLTRLMAATAKWLAEETNACCAYTQSDEISLAWHSDDVKSQIFFDGRIQKMTSQLAALATAHFNRYLGSYFPGDMKIQTKTPLPTFDARVWSVPTLEEAANCFIWREQDATRNSVQMAAQAYYSHKQLFGKNTSEMQEMLHARGVNWNDYPYWFKRGQYILRRTVSKPFTTDELERLPPLHEARKNPSLVVERSEYALMELPRLASLSNRVGVLFFGEEPVEVA